MSHLTPLSLPLHLLTEVNHIFLQAVVAITTSHSASHLLWIQWLSPRGSTLSHLGTGLAEMMKGYPGAALPLLQSARIAPHRGRKKGFSPSLGSQEGNRWVGRPETCCAKARSDPKDSFSAILGDVLPHPSFTLRPTPAITQSERTTSLGKTF